MLPTLRIARATSGRTCRGDRIPGQRNCARESMPSGPAAYAPEYALIDLASGKPFGQASYLNIDPDAGSIEVGGIVFYAPAFQREIAATEAMYLMMHRVFD